MSGVKIFFILWGISIAGMYYMFTRSGGPLVLPGDIYIKKGDKTIYFPIGSSFFIAIVLYVVLSLLGLKAK